MARVTEFPSTFRPIWIWDITDKVGWGLVNRRADVQLVQLSINKLIPKLGLVDYRRKPSPGPLPGMGVYPPLAPLKVDGLMGNETANAIKSYTALKGNTTDQAVDPVYPLLARLHGDPVSPSAIAAGSALRKRTMFTLNSDHLAKYGRLLDNSEFPEPLRSEVKKRH
jgi:hypothetical protein